MEHVIYSSLALRTMLTKFFTLCSQDDEARNFLYKEFPKHYVWNRQSKSSTKRKDREVIGRVNVANPSKDERYYLRLLLNHVRGPKSFENLLSYNGHQYLSFKEAAQKRGMLESDDSISKFFHEIETFQMPLAMRHLFSTILVYCQPTDVRKLWNTHFEAISKDFCTLDSQSIESQMLNTLKSVNFFLESMGKSCANYDLPMLDLSLPNLLITHSR